MKKLICFILCLPIFYSSTFSQERYAVLITEFLSDPSPQQNLPDAEFIELTNVSSQPVDLLNWQIGDNASKAVIRKNYLLLPGKQVIICPRTAEADYAAFGEAIGITGFPSLNNDGDHIILYAPDETVIHAIAYSTENFNNPVKAAGGWSMEMINLNLPCKGIENFIFSTDPSGGTPGRTNTVNTTVSQEIPLSIKNIFFLNDFNLVIQFSEAFKEEMPAAITIEVAGLSGSISDMQLTAPFYNELLVKINRAAEPGKIYPVSILNLINCEGKKYHFKELKSAFPVHPTEGEIVINEILFNPTAGGSDFVEIYNVSHQVFDLQNLLIAGRNTAFQIHQVYKVSEKPLLFFPGEFAVISQDTNYVITQFQVINSSGKFLASSLPSLPDDKGTVLLLKENGEIIDEVNYSSKWHHPVIRDENGVTLEKIDPTKASASKDNWASAASSFNYGTPGAVNSQYKKLVSPVAILELQPAIFSPDGDGYDDVLHIKYKTAIENSFGTIRAYDRAGRAMANILQNGVLGKEGFILWDGYNNKKEKLPAGIYIIELLIINPAGSTEKFLKPVVIAY